MKSKFGQIYIIGGSGVMGQLLNDRIALMFQNDRNHSFECEIFDKGDKLSIRSGTNKLPNLVIIATPIKEILSVVKKLAKLKITNVYFTEIGSVKGNLVKAYQEEIGGTKFLSVHPMIGPLAKDWKDIKWSKYNCLFIDAFEKIPEHRAIRGFWRDLGFICHDIDATYHDEIIGKLSHLSHFLVKTYVNYVHNTLSKEELSLAGPSFKFFEKLAKGSERLKDMFDTNSALPTLLKEFKGKL